MKHRIDEKELLERLSQLPREIEPDNDVWADVAARMDASSPSVYAGKPAVHWPLRAAAAAVLALALGLILTAVWRVAPDEATRLVNDAPPGQTAVAPAGPEQEVVFAGLLAGNDAEYQAAFREYMALSPEVARLPEDTMMQIETGWAALVRMESELLNALSANPDDPFLNGRMLELRERQLGYLKQLAALDRNNRRLTI